MAQLGVGFDCLDMVQGVVEYPVKASVTIAKGDALKDDGAGFAQLVTTSATSSDFLGIAASPANNGTGIDGAINVAIIPPLPQYKFYVYCGTGTLVPSDRGEFLAFKDEDEVDRTAAAPTTGYAPWVYAIDTTNNYAYVMFRLAG